MNSREQAIAGELSEVDAAKTKLPHVAVLAAAQETAVHNTRGILGLLIGSCNGGFLCHVICL